MTKINQHTPGPLRYAGFIGEGKCNGTHSVDSKGLCVLDNPRPSSVSDAEGEQNAKLSVAAYNAFDRAGREWLGIDATELAEKMDLIKILREWAYLKMLLGSETTGLEDTGVTRDLLALKFGLEKVSR